MIEMSTGKISYAVLSYGWFLKEWVIDCSRFRGLH